MKIYIDKGMRILIITQLILIIFTYFLNYTGRKASAVFVAHSLNNRYKDYFEYKKKNSAKPIGEIIYDYSKSKIKPQKLIVIDEIVKEKNFLGLDDYDYMQSYITAVKRNNPNNNYNYYWLRSAVENETDNIMREYKLLIILNNITILAVSFIILIAAYCICFRIRAGIVKAWSYLTKKYKLKR